MGLRDLVRWGEGKSAANGAAGRPLMAMQREMNDLFDTFSRGWLSAWGNAVDAENGFGTFGPRLDVHETDKTVEVRAELPGMSEKDIDLTLSASGDVLILRGEKKLDWSDSRGGTHRRERYFGSFSRNVALPTSVALKDATATFERGVLTVSLPKQTHAGHAPKKIPIKIG